MAFKGTAAKSSSGASMSKYDVEVEGRLKALETAVAALKADSHPDRSGGAAPAGVSERLETLISEVKKHFKINI
jgi:isopropylmalate/homocitrate/citramalate synthase